MTQEDALRAIAFELQEAEHDLTIAFDDESVWAARGRRLAATRIARSIAANLPDGGMFLQRCGVRNE